jgi:hypothetical protein
MLTHNAQSSTFDQCLTFKATREEYKDRDELQHVETNKKLLLEQIG